MPFTGEGAYHGSTKPRKAPRRPAPGAPVAEMAPTTLAAYPQTPGRKTVFRTFSAPFTNCFEVVGRLPVPSQEAVRDDGVTFCWCPLQEALSLAGPLTGAVIREMARHLAGTKRYVYIDSKIQYFEPGDVPVDSQLWHVDGSIVVRGEQAERLGYPLLHDMRARCEATVAPPRYLSYLSSADCATELAVEPLSVELPELVPNFDQLDQRVRARRPRAAPQSAGAIVRFDGLSLHRPRPARAAGWRLWVRCIESDRKVVLSPTVIHCYGNVFRPQ